MLDAASLIQEIPKDLLAEAVNKGNKYSGNAPFTGLLGMAVCCWTMEPIEDLRTAARFG